MTIKIVRNDITKMQCDAIVNTANDYPTVGTGCDYAVYKAAGYNQLLKYREENIGFVPEGDVFVTPAFDLEAKYIIHTVSPHYIDGKQGEEDKLRSCYQKSLELAYENKVESIAFPLISTGGFKYPKEEGIFIAIDEINTFLKYHDMLVYLVVFDAESTMLGNKIYPDLEAYIDANYVEEKNKEEYKDAMSSRKISILEKITQKIFPKTDNRDFNGNMEKNVLPYDLKDECLNETDEAIENLERDLANRMEHLTDSFSDYLIHLISSKGMSNVEVYKRALIDKKVFSKIKNNPNYHPQKITALCLCIGARLNLDETKDLLARAGYALSPCDKTDIIFSYFIENEIYDMVNLDIQLEEYGLPCIIS